MELECISEYQTVHCDENKGNIKKRVVLKMAQQVVKYNEKAGIFRQEIFRQGFPVCKLIKK